MFSAETNEHQRNSLKRHIPNLITGGRFLLVPVIVMLLLSEQYTWTVLVFLIAGLSDGLDGFIAKHYDWRSQLGAVMDPLADKVLIFGTYLTLSWQGLIPAWLAVLVILRDAIIICGAMLHYKLTHTLEMSPILVSKFNTAVQMLLVLAVVLAQATGKLPAWLVGVLIGLTLVTTLVSGISYLIAWTRKTVEKLHSRHA